MQVVVVAYIAKQGSALSMETRAPELVSLRTCLKHGEFKKVGTDNAIRCRRTSKFRASLVDLSTVL